MQRLYTWMAGVVLCGLVSGLVAGEEEMVVTATRSPREASTVPASVSVVSRSELEALPAWNLDDALRSLEGVFVLRSVGLGTGLPSQINIRGVAGQHAVLLLLDGLPLNDAASGFMNINQVPVAAAKQIEVVRGPFSSLYGADAFAGVINILSVDPGSIPALELSVKVGEDDFLETTAQAGYGTPELGVTAVYSGRTTDNYLGRDHVTLRQWNPMAGSFYEFRMDAMNYDYEDQRLLIKVLSELSENVNLEVYGRYFDSELGYGQIIQPTLYPLPVDSVIMHESLLAGARLTGPVGTGEASVTAYYREHSQEALGLNLSHLSGASAVYVPSEQETESTDWKIDTIYRAALGEGHRISAGADLLVNDADFGPQTAQESGAALPLSGATDEGIQNAGLYVQDELTLGDRYELISGLRLDSHSEFGEAVSPKAGLRVGASDNTVLRASVGRAYRAPTLLELYQPATFFGSVTFVSNEDLDPEYILSADVGIAHRVSPTLTAHLDCFYNDMDDLITKRVMGSTLMFDNTSDAWSAGVEAGVEWDAVPGLLAVTVNYTGQQTEDGELGDDLEHMPEHAGNIGIRLTQSVGDWTAELSVTESYVGSRGYRDFSSGLWQDLDEYWRTDLGLRTTYRDVVWVGLSVENATDEAYQEWPLVARAPSRIVAIEAGIRTW